MALIPIDTVGLDDVVEHPALLVEAFDHRRALGGSVRPVALAANGVALGANVIGYGGGRGTIGDGSTRGGRKRA